MDVLLVRASAGVVKPFKQEFLALKSIGKHDNIVSFLGMCNNGPAPIALFDFCAMGNLRDFLRKHRSVPALLPVQTQLQFALDICSGMAYLELHGVVHGNLAAFVASIKHSIASHSHMQTNCVGELRECLQAL